MTKIKVLANIGNYTRHFSTFIEKKLLREFVLSVFDHPPPGRGFDFFCGSNSTLLYSHTFFT